MVRRCLFFLRFFTYWLIHQKALPEGKKSFYLKNCNLKIIILLRICLNQTSMTLGKKSRKFPCLNMGRLLWEIPENFPQLPALKPWGLMGWWGRSKSFGRSMLNPVMAWSPWRSPVAFFGDWMDWKKKGRHHGKSCWKNASVFGGWSCWSKTQHTHFFKFEPRAFVKLSYVKSVPNKHWSEALESGSFGCSRLAAFSGTKLPTTWSTWSKLETPKAWNQEWKSYFKEAAETIAAEMVPWLCTIVRSK